jgi:endonuclease/exonuclease/phosphatase family metal-dependent hydrolase
MQAKIFNFGISKMSWINRLIAYTTLLFNFFLLFSYFAYLSDPTRTTWIAFTALVYPILITSNIVLCTYWLIRKNLFFLPTLLLIIGGFYHHSRFFQFSYGTYSLLEDQETVKIMSYNVRLFDLYNWTENKETKKAIINQIKEENPDVVCFQEYFYSSKNDFITRDMIIKELNMPYFHESFSDESNETSFFGLATFSKYPIINKENHRFKNDNSNQCMWSDVVLADDTLRVYNAHLGSIRFNYSDYKVIGGKGSPLWPHQEKPKQKILKRLNDGFKKRSIQVKELITLLNKSKYSRIICSDINDTPMSFAYHQLDKYFKDSFINSGNGIGSTYIGKFPGLRIDYIWHDKVLTSFNFTTHSEELSDHRAISTTIIIP